MQHGIVEELGRIPMAPNLAATLVRAAETARSQYAPAVTLEHLLLALTDDPDAGTILQVSSIDAARLRNDIFAHLAATSAATSQDTAGDVVISQDLRRVLEASAAAAQQGRRREINGAIVLAAIVGDGRSLAAQILRAHGLTFEDAIKALQRAVQGAQPARPASAAPPGQQPAPPPAPVAVPPQSVQPGASQSTEELLATVRERIGSAGAKAQSPQEADVPPTRPPPQVYAPLPPQPPQPPRPAAPYEPQWEAAGLPPSTGAPSAVAPAQPPAPEVEPPHQPAPARQVRTAPPQQPPPPAMPQEMAARPQPPRPTPPPVPAAPAPVVAAPRAAPPAMPDMSRPAAPPWPEPAHQEPARRPPPQPAQAYPPQPSAVPGSYDTPAQAPRPAGGRPPPPMQPRTGPPPQPAPAQHSAAPVERRTTAPAIEPGQLIENIPRKMRTGVPALVEVRIGRDKVQSMARGMSGQTAQHTVQVTRAMSVRLRAPDHGFFIETASPETQWIDNTLGVNADDFASWRWTVTPNARGTRRLQMIVSARTVGPDGLAAETALPDQVVEVKVRVNYAAMAKQAAGWVVAAVLGGALAKFGEGGLDVARALMRSFGG